MVDLLEQNFLLLKGGANQFFRLLALGNILGHNLHHAEFVNLFVFNILVDRESRA